MSSADSSGFEHVFVGETKFGREIMGLHNWVQFYLQEKAKQLDYKGYKASRNDLVTAPYSYHRHSHRFLATANATEV